MREGGKTVRSCLWAAVVLAVAAVAAISMPAMAQTAADRIAALIGERYGVKVLRVAAAVDAGRAIYRLTVMSKGGDFDGAFQVTTIAVDAETGELIPQFRHLPSGYVLPGAPSYDGDITRPDAAQSGVVWR